MTKIDIKLLSENDASLLQKAASLFHPDKDISINRCKQMLLEERDYYIIACNGDNPVGWIIGYTLKRFHGDDMFLYEIDVKEEYQKQGIASMLIEKLKQIAIQNNCVEMWVPTNKSNTPAMRLYQKTGGNIDYEDGVQLTWELKKS